MKTGKYWTLFGKGNIDGGLLHEIIDGRMRGKPTRGRRRIQMLHDLANDGGFFALKRAAEDTEGCQETAVQQRTILKWIDLSCTALLLTDLSTNY